MSTVVVDMSFLNLSGNGATAFATVDKAGKGKEMLSSATFSGTDNLLNSIEHLFRNEGFMLHILGINLSSQPQSSSKVGMCKEIMNSRFPQFHALSRT